MLKLMIRVPQTLVVIQTALREPDNCPKKSEFGAHATYLNYMPKVGWHNNELWSRLF